MVLGTRPSALFLQNTMRCKVYKANRITPWLILVKTE